MFPLAVFFSAERIFGCRCFVAGLVFVDFFGCVVFLVVSYLFHRCFSFIASFGLIQLFPRNS